MEPAEAHTSRDLVDMLYSMVRKSPASKFWWSWFRPEENLWTNRHEQINYKGETLDVKLPMFCGWLLIHKIRPIGEKYFNDSFTVSEKWSAAIEREAEVLKQLNKSGYPTLELRQDIIADKLYLEDKLLLTAYIWNASNVVQLLSTESEARKLELIEQGSELLYRLHRYEDTVWGDPWMGNLMLKGDNMILHDFGFCPNCVHDKEYLFARDLLGFAVSAKYRSGLEADDVAQAILNQYKIGSDMKQAVRKAVEYDENRNPALQLIKSYTYDRLVSGMPEDDVMHAKRKLISQL